MELRLVLTLLTRRDKNMFWKRESSCKKKEESESSLFSALLERRLHHDNGEGIEGVVEALIRII